MSPDQDEKSPEFYANPVNSIGYLTRITFRSFSRALERRTLPSGVSSGQWRFLRVLWTEEGLTQRELSVRVGMREPTTVTALKSLERSGLVTRVPSELDRRKIHIYLTPRAKRLKTKLLPFVAEVNAIASEGIDPGEIAVLRRVLTRMSANLAKDEEANRPRVRTRAPLGAAEP